MEIDKTINKWFGEIEGRSKQLGLPKNNIDRMILGSIPIIDNYSNSVLMILNDGSRLPAMALLRVLAEFILKLIYCLKADDSSVDKRIESWEKTSLIQRGKYYKDIIDIYHGCNRKNVHEWIDETESELAKIEGVDALPSVATIFEQVFEKDYPVDRAGMYLQYLGAVHIDLEVLAKTISKSGTEIEYKGDVSCNIEDLKFECLTHAYIFFRHLYEYYSLDLQKIENEYKMLIPKN